MNKQTSKTSPMFNKIKNYHRNLDDSLDIDVVANQFCKLSLSLDKRWQKFYNFFYSKSAHLLVLANIEKVLKYHYGRCDFKCEANREYKNYIIEHHGVYFITSTKPEFVVPDDKTNLDNIVMSFYYELFKLTIDYLDNNEPSMPIDKELAKWREKGIIIGYEHKSLID